MGKFVGFVVEYLAGVLLDFGLSESQTAIIMIVMIPLIIIVAGIVFLRRPK
jgi:hypothetical protein